jgi:uncharacterized protein (DUF488 family)
VSAGEIFTVGHSTHPIDEFSALLAAADVELVADVRRFPGSRRNPQFGSQALEQSLEQAGIGYRAMGESLGGRRAADPERSDNAGWENRAFRGYADYTSSAEFAAGLEELESRARERRTAVMCAEAHPSRCHRRLIADSLLARGWDVTHLLADGRREPHTLSPHAVVEAGRVSYPAQPTLGI